VKSLVLGAYLRVATPIEEGNERENDEFVGKANALYLRALKVRESGHALLKMAMDERRNAFS
jgi:hypothetical protein